MMMSYTAERAGLEGLEAQVADLKRRIIYGRSGFESDTMCHSL